MSLKRIATILAFVAALVLAGCASNTQTEKQKAKEQWSKARAGVLCGLAKQQFQSGDFDNCGKTLEQATQLDPHNIGIHVLKSRLLIEQGKLELAERALEAARQIDPKNAESYYLSGVIFQRWERNQAAYDNYVKASDLAPAELPYLLARAETLVSLGRGPEALALLQEKLQYFENSGAIRDAVGQLLVQQRKYAEAVDALRQAYILSPDEPSIREHLAMAQFQAGKYQDASMTVGRMVQDERWGRRADMYMVLGQCQMELKKVPDARASFETAAQLDPGNAVVWLNLAKAAMDLNDTKRAELSLRKSLTLDSASAEGHLMLGYLRMRQNRDEEAATAFRTASQLDPKDPVSLCMVGLMLEKAGKPNEAAVWYAKALKLSPADDLASRLMADIQLGE